MGDVNSFSDVDSLIKEARDNFRTDSAGKLFDIKTVFNLYLDILKFIGSTKSLEEWTGSREEDVLKILVKTSQTVLAMLYLSEDGFYYLSNVFLRNYVELLMSAIAIGHDPDLHIAWKHRRDDFKDVHTVARKILQLQALPTLEKQLIPTLLKHWNEASDAYSHQISKDAVEQGLKFTEGNFSMEPLVLKEEYQDNRKELIRNMLLNIISVVIGIFKDTYNEEAKPLVERYNAFVD